ncbi:MAG: pilin [Candidatus Saccharibacteria bacterium]|nr:pilin [Candidatus Saccharibacteria bacterium]
MTLKNAFKLFAVTAGSVISIGLLTPTFVQADAQNDILNSVNSTDPGGPTVDNALTAAITVFTIIVGVAAVIMVILSGYKYITSGGDSNKVAQAKSTVIYALIGVALVVTSQVILRFVIAKSRSTTGGAAPVVCAPGRPC